MSELYSHSIPPDAFGAGPQLTGQELFDDASKISSQVPRSMCESAIIGNRGKHVKFQSPRHPSFQLDSSVNYFPLSPLPQNKFRKLELSRAKANLFYFVKYF